MNIVTLFFLALLETGHVEMNVQHFESVPECNLAAMAIEDAYLDEGVEHFIYSCNPAYHL